MPLYKFCLSLLESLFSLVLIHTTGSNTSINIHSQTLWWSQTIRCACVIIFFYQYVIDSLMHSNKQDKYLWFSAVSVTEARHLFVKREWRCGLGVGGSACFSRSASETKYHQLFDGGDTVTSQNMSLFFGFQDLVSALTSCPVYMFALEALSVNLLDKHQQLKWEENKCCLWNFLHTVKLEECFKRPICSHLVLLLWRPRSSVPVVICAWR